MPAKKVNSLNDVIFGNKSVETSARLLPPNRGPVSTDPEWNELVDALQDLTIGHHHDGVDSRFIPNRILLKGQNTLTIAAGSSDSGFVTVATGFNVTGSSAMTGIASVPSGLNETFTVQTQISPFFGGSLLLDVFRSPTSWSVSTDLSTSHFALTEPGLFGWDGSTPPVNTVTPVYGAARSVVINWAIVTP